MLDVGKPKFPIAAPQTHARRFILISVVQEKTGESVPLRVHCDLLKVLMSTERKSEIILTTRAGKPFTKTQLTKAIKGSATRDRRRSVPASRSAQGRWRALGRSGRERAAGHGLLRSQDASDGSDEAMKLWERAP
jgi:hypothetical protein